MTETATRGSCIGLKTSEYVNAINRIVYYYIYERMHNVLLFTQHNADETVFKKNQRYSNQREFNKQLSILCS